MLVLVYNIYEMNYNKKSQELTKRINTILDSMWHWGEFWLVVANKTWYTVYAENVCFDVLDE